MITVAILINGSTIVARSAVNQRKQNKNGETLYVTDAGVKIYHKREDGALKLAKLMLDTVKEI